MNMNWIRIINKLKKNDNDNDDDTEFHISL